MLIEDKASGTQLIQELIMEGCHAVAKYTPECDKMMRLYAQTAVIENGFVHVPQAAPWLAKYLHEMTVFPKGKHDDQVDSTAQFLDWVKKTDVELGHLRALPGNRSKNLNTRNAAAYLQIVSTRSCIRLTFGLDCTGEISTRHALQLVWL